MERDRGDRASGSFSQCQGVDGGVDGGVEAVSSFLQPPILPAACIIPFSGRSHRLLKERTAPHPRRSPAEAVAAVAVVGAAELLPLAVQSV